MHYAAITALLYALTVVTAPLAYAYGASVVLVLGVRFACNVVLASAFEKAASSRTDISASDVWFIGGSSIALLGQTYGLMSAVKVLPVSIAITVFFTFPIMNYVLEVLRGRRRLSPLTILVLLVAVVGVWFLSDTGSSQWGYAGLAWALMAAVFQAVLNETAGQVNTVRGWRMVRLTSLLPMTVYIAWAILTEPKPSFGGVGWSVVSATCFAVGLYLYYHSVSTYGAVRTANILYLEPVFAILLSMVIFDEALSLWQWLGVLMVAAATGLVEYQEFKRNRSAFSPPPASFPPG